MVFAFARWGIASGVLLLLVVLPVDSRSRLCAQTADPPPAGMLRPPPQASIIFGSDRRTRVANTTVFPWSTIGQVQAVFGFMVLEGTGVMIGKNTVLTSAHVVYDPALGGWADAIDFIPGLNGSSEPFGRVEVIRRSALPAWVERGDESADIAVLGLNSMVGDETGFMQISMPSASFVNGLALLSAGYPADLNHDFQYFAPGPGLGVENGFLLEQIDTEPGQSGSPIWYEDAETGQPRLIAILKGTRESTNGLGLTTVEGIGVLITPAIATFINQILTAGGDTQQAIPPTPAAPADPVPPTVPRCGTCGAGTGQAILLCTLGWTACLLVRHRRGI
jgi:V8-like Glu-specific endopeptidase